MQELSWIITIFDAIRILVYETSIKKKLVSENDIAVKTDILLKIFCINSLNYVYKTFDELHNQSYDMDT